MSTRDEAIRVIRQQTLVSDLATSKDIARKLEYAGLLAPDLPEPSRGMFPRGAVWYLTGQIGDIRRTEERIVAFGRDCRSQPFRLVLTEAEAEAIAHVLLAAANYAEDEEVTRE